MIFQLRGIVAEGDSTEGLRLLRAAARIRLHPVLVEEGARFQERWGPSAEVSRMLVMPLFRMRGLDEALAMARRAVELDPDDASGWRLLADREWDSGDVRAAVRATLAAYRADVDAEQLQLYLRQHEVPASLDAGTFRTLATELLPAPDMRKTALAAYEAGGQSGATDTQLVANLEEAVRRVRRAGARTAPGSRARGTGRPSHDLATLRGQHRGKQGDTGMRNGPTFS